MAITTEIPLCEQREALRQQIKNQREVISLTLIKATAANNSYPRSMTMRFLTQQPGTKILAEVLSLAIGARFFKSITKAITFARIVKSFSTNTSKV